MPPVNFEINLGDLAGVWPWARDASPKLSNDRNIPYLAVRCFTQAFGRHKHSESYGTMLHPGFSKPETLTSPAARCTISKINITNRICALNRTKRNTDHHVCWGALPETVFCCIIGGEDERQESCCSQIGKALPYNSFVWIFFAICYSPGVAKQAKGTGPTDKKEGIRD